MFSHTRVLLFLLQKQLEGWAWLLGRDCRNPFLLKPSSRHPDSSAEVTSAVTAPGTGFPPSREALSNLLQNPVSTPNLTRFKALNEMTANKR